MCAPSLIVTVGESRNVSRVCGPLSAHWQMQPGWQPPAPAIRGMPLRKAAERPCLEQRVQRLRRQAQPGRQGGEQLEGGSGALIKVCFARCAETLLRAHKQEGMGGAGVGGRIGGWCGMRSARNLKPAAADAGQCPLAACHLLRRHWTGALTSPSGHWLGPLSTDTEVAPSAGSASAPKSKPSRWSNGYRGGEWGAGRILT